MRSFGKNIPAYFLIVLAVSCVIIWYAVFYFALHRDFAITFFDVGQGDSIWIETAEGHQILVDGGPGDRVLAKLGREMPFWDRSIDGIISTHPDQDHIAGLLPVLEKYDVGFVLWTGVKGTNAEYREWMRLIEDGRVRNLPARRGARLGLGRAVTLEILAPFADLRGASVSKTNNTSVVAMLRHGRTSALLTGDIERAMEYRLVFEDGAGLDADILKVGHHGSKTSSSAEFLAAVSPEVAVIQVGRRNRYGHPTAEVLDRLSSIGAATLRTDTDSDVRFVSDGVHWQRR